MLLTITSVFYYTHTLAKVKSEKNQEVVTILKNQKITKTENVIGLVGRFKTLLELCAFHKEVVTKTSIREK